MFIEKSNKAAAVRDTLCLLVRFSFFFWRSVSLAVFVGVFFF